MRELRSNALPAASVFCPLLAASVLNEDAAHGLGRRGEEVASAVEFLVPN